MGKNAADYISKHFFGAGQQNAADSPDFSFAEKEAGNLGVEYGKKAFDAGLVNLPPCKNGRGNGEEVKHPLAWNVKQKHQKNNIHDIKIAYNNADNEFFCKCLFMKIMVEHDIWKKENTDRVCGKYL